MAGFIPAIRVLLPIQEKDVDGRDKPGHDECLCYPNTSSTSPSRITVVPSSVIVVPNIGRSKWPAV